MYNGPEEEEKEDARHIHNSYNFFFSLNQNAARKRMKCQIWEYGTEEVSMTTQLATGS
jgi:hypothetical protein